MGSLESLRVQGVSVFTLKRHIINAVISLIQFETELNRESWFWTWSSWSTRTNRTIWERWKTRCIVAELSSVWSPNGISVLLRYSFFILFFPQVLVNLVLLVKKVNREALYPIQVCFNLLYILENNGMKLIWLWVWWSIRNLLCWTPWSSWTYWTKGITR